VGVTSVDKRAGRKVPPQEKACTECNALYLGGNRSKYCSISCSNKAYWKHSMLVPMKRLTKLCAMAKNRAKEKGLAFNLTPELLYQMWEDNNGCCAITGTQFDLAAYGDKGQVSPNAPSVDRITPTLGYVAGNVRLVTYHTNVALSEFGLEKLKQLARLIVRA